LLRKFLKNLSNLTKTSCDEQVECETRMKAIELKEICVDIDIQLPREECRKEEREECRYEHWGVQESFQCFSVSSLFRT
jgi:hypothetical protein